MLVWFRRKIHRTFVLLNNSPCRTKDIDAKRRETQNWITTEKSTEMVFNSKRFFFVQSVCMCQNALLFFLLSYIEIVPVVNWELVRHMSFSDWIFQLHHKIKYEWKCAVFDVLHWNNLSKLSDFNFFPFKHNSIFELFFSSCVIDFFFSTSSSVVCAFFNWCWCDRHNYWSSLSNETNLLTFIDSKEIQQNFFHPAQI